MRQVIDYKLFDRDEYFFTPNFCENSFLKDLLIKKYSTGIDVWKKKHNSGNIKNDSEIKKKYSEIYNISEDAILAVYIEKKRKRYIVVLYNNMIIIEQKAYKLEQESIQSSYITSICEDKYILTDEFIDLIADLKNIIWDDNTEIDFHPCSKADYYQREIYIKMLISFCALNIGVSAKQLIFLKGIAEKFEIASKKLLKVFKLIYSCQKNELVDLQKNIYTDIDDKEDLLLDLMVLSCIGNYSYSKKNDIKKYLTHLFEVTDTDYDKCLYYMEEQGR